MPGDDDAKYISEIAPPAKPRRASIDLDEESALDLIAQHESGGQNIHQNIVPAGGGYNPSVGRVTGPSSAQGPWQIVNSTWRKRAPREVVQQYPTAMSAPVEVQREVARKMYRETGFQDWAPYNAGLRAALRRGDLPQSTDSRYISSLPDEDAKYVTDVPQQPQQLEPAQQPSRGFLHRAPAQPQQPAAPSSPVEAAVRGVLQTSPPAQPKQATYNLVQPQPKTAEYGAIAGALEAAQPQKFSDDPELNKAISDVEWHFGPAVVNSLHLLDPAARTQVMREATRLAQADEAKRARGEPIVKSVQWQQANQRRLGLDKNTAVRDEAVSLQRRSQLLTNQSPEAQAAAQRQQAEEFAALPWWQRGAITGATGVTEVAGGVLRALPHDPLDKSPSLAQPFERMSQDIRTRQAGAAAISPPGLLEKAEEGAITYAPLMLASPAASVEGLTGSALAKALAGRAAVGGAQFGGYSGMQAYGGGASAGEAVKEGAKAVPLGALLAMPSTALPFLAERPLAQAAVGTAGKVAGTYGIARAEGASHQEALDQAAMIAGFEAPGLGWEGIKAVSRQRPAPPVETAVRPAMEAAFERAGISPEAQNKALNQSLPDARQAAVESAESQRAVSPNPAVLPPQDVADYWKVRTPDNRVEAFNNRQEAEHRAAELAGELPTAEYPAVKSPAMAYNPAESPRPEESLGAQPLVKPETAAVYREELQQQAQRGEPPEQPSEAASQPPAQPERVKRPLSSFDSLTDNIEPSDFLVRGKEKISVRDLAAQAGGDFDNFTATVGAMEQQGWQRIRGGPESLAGRPEIDVPKRHENGQFSVIEDGVRRFYGSRAEAQAALGSQRGEGGFAGERQPIKPAPEGVRTGAVEDLPPAERMIVGSLNSLRNDAFRLGGRMQEITDALETAKGDEQQRLITEYNEIAPKFRAIVDALNEKKGVERPVTPERRPVDQQPRAETGQFAETTDFSAVKSELLRTGQRLQEDYARIAQHTARREGLRTASGMAVRDYFTKLHKFVATNAPDKLPLVEQAEAAEAKGDPLTATLLSERALSGTHDFVNRLSSAVLATDIQAKGLELPARNAANWRDVLAEVRERNKRAESWERQRGAVKLGEEGKPAPGGIRTGAVADLEAPQRKPRTLPKSLAATEREPGTDLFYDVLPNPETAGKVQERLNTEGVEATEKWYRDAPPSAERTDAFRQLADHYLAASLKAEGTEAKQLRAKAVELANIESPRATEAGQTVQAYAMLDKYTGPEVLLQAEQLAEKAGKQLPDEVVKDIAETGFNFKQADDLLKAIRAELEVLRKARKGTQAEEGKRQKRITQLEDAQEKALADRRTAKIRQVETLAKLEGNTRGYWTRTMNILRGLMVSAIPTAVRNAESQGIRFGVERLVDVFAHALRRATAQDPHITTQGIWRDTLRIFQKESKGRAIAIAGEYPRELKRLFASYGAGGADVAKPNSPFAGKIARAFGNVENFVQIANFANTLQEFHIRGAEFLAHLDMLVEREKGMTLEKFIKQYGADKLPKEAIEDSVTHALEVTFADAPPRDTDTGKALNSMIQVGNLIPPTLSPVPFARWFYNSWKFLYQFSPVGFADYYRTPRQLREARRALTREQMRPAPTSDQGIANRASRIAKAEANVARQEQNAKIERYRTISKGLIGSAMLFTAYQARVNAGGEKWYELKVPGTDHLIDTRPFGPFSTYLFIAEGIRRWLHGERQFSFAEVTQAIGSSTVAGGGAEALYDRIRSGDWDGVTRFLATEAGQVGTAILTPIRQTRDLIGQFDKSQATTYDTSTQPFLGPLKTSIPFGERLGTPLTPAYRPTDEQPIHTPMPATKFIGPRVEQQKNFVEHELDRLRFDYTEIFHPTGVPAADRLLKQYQGEFVGQEAPNLAADPDYQKASDPERAMMLQDLLNAAREDARGRLGDEHPELMEQIDEKHKPRRQREYEKSLGLSKAVELGVPQTIPPRGADETDVAYRARLLQLGRARRARLDAATDSENFTALNTGQQRKSLYNTTFGV